MDKWKGVGRHWTLKGAQKLNIFDIGKMSTQEKAELAQFYYRQLSLRTNTFLKANTIPYAFTKLYKDFDRIQKSDMTSPDQKLLTLDEPVVVPNGKYRQLNENFASMRNPDAQLRNYIMRMQSFFGSKTSTVKGWQEVAEAQDAKLFGTEAVSQGNKYGYIIDPETGRRKRVPKFGPFIEIRPKHRLNDDERRKLWEIIDLAKDAGWLNVYGYDSDQAHRQIASMFISGDFDVNDIDNAYHQILEKIREKQQGLDKYPEYPPNEPMNPIARTDEGGDINDVWGRDVFGR